MLPRSPESTTEVGVTTTAESHAHEEQDHALAVVFAGYTASATVWLLFATGVGLLLAFKFGAPDFLPGEWLTFGRLRPCLLYTSDAADERSSVDLGGRRI